MIQEFIQTYGLQLFTGLILSVFLVRLSTLIAAPFGLVDHPVGRKDHAHPTPVTGGLGIFFALLACSLLFNRFELQLTVFFIAGAMLLLIGVLDDRYDLSSRIRFIVQALAATIMIYFAGLQANEISDVVGIAGFHLGWMTPLFTIFITIG